MNEQQAGTDASEYVIATGAHKGMTLGEIFAVGAKGEQWFKNRLSVVSEPQEYVDALWSFALVYLPEVFQAELERREGRSPLPRRRAKDAGHRAEVQRRWSERRAVQVFEEAFARDSHVQAVLADLVHLSQWAAPSRLLDAVDLAPPAREVLLNELVRVVVLKEMPYDEYLQTDEWTAKAAAAKQRYNGRCALDATHPADHAHHRTYVRRGREHATDLIPLCAECHAKFHNRRP